MEQRNMIMAFVLSMLVLVSWQALFPGDPVQDEAVVTQADGLIPSSGDSTLATTPAADDVPDMSLSSQVQHTAAKTKAQSRVLTELHNDVLSLKLNEQGALIAATTTRYRQTMDADSPPVSVLDTTAKHPLYINAGVLGQALPVFSVDSVQQNSNGASVHLKTTLADGNLWLRTISLQSGSYVIEMHDKIAGSANYEMFQQVVARNPDRDASNIYQFIGPVSLLEDKLIEHSYDDLDDESPIKQKARGGWTGIMEPYFIAALIGETDRVYDYYYKGNGNTYQAGRLASGERDGSSTNFVTNIYIGPKATTIMKALNVGLERSVDYGWFAVIAKPLHHLLIWLYQYLGNYGLCIIVLVLMIKTLFYWPTKKAYESMADMRKLQPEMARMRELHGDDRQKMGQEMMAMYKKNKVNPMGGCLPIVIQIPVFFALYKSLLVSIELRHAPFYGWITDLSAMDPYYVLPIVMGASMIIQQRLNPAPPDPLQAKVMKFLPIIFTFMFLFFPSGLVLYWLVNNILSIAQQWYILKLKNAL
ncbi:MAG: membrane protein insertase YidC [Mariprofundaceae bacterium]|nr:membrane protein insertase YidC [Mariprofundaceae bacterium]